MALNLILHRLSGDEVTVDVEGVNPPTQISALSDAEVSAAGVTTGTQLVAGGVTYQLLESLVLLQAAVRAVQGVASELAITFGRQSAPFSTASGTLTTIPTTAASPPTAGRYLVLGMGMLENDDVANSRSAIQIMRNGAVIVGTLSVVLCTANTTPMAVIVYRIVDDAIGADVFTLAGASVPGGAGDNTSVSSGIIALIKFE